MDNLLNFNDEYFDDNVDEDGSKYEFALSYIKEKGVDSSDLEALAKVMKFSNEKQEELISKLDELIDMENNEEELNETFEEINYCRDLSFGILSMMLDFQYCGLKSWIDVFTSTNVFLAYLSLLAITKKLFEDLLQRAFEMQKIKI